MRATAYAFHGFEFRPGDGSLTEGGAPVFLGSRAMALLAILLENAGNYVSPERLIAAAWPDTFVHEGNLRVQMAALRKRLQSGSARVLIRNSPGRGYSFVGGVDALEAGEPNSAVHLKLDITVAHGVSVQSIIAQVTPVLRQALATLEGSHGKGHDGQMIRSGSP